MDEFGLTPDLYRELKNARGGPHGKFSIDRVFGALVKEPYNVPHAALGDLTPVIVRHVYFRSQEDDDTPDFDPIKAANLRNELLRKQHEIVAAANQQPVSPHAPPASEERNRLTPPLHFHDKRKRKRGK